MEQIKLTATDLDRTFLTPDSKLPAGTFDLIKRLDAAGIEFVAASGRGVYTLAEMFAPVLDHMTLLAENGAVLKRRGKLLHTFLLEPEAFQPLVAYVREQDAGRAMLCGLAGTYLDKQSDEVIPDITSFVSEHQHVEDAMTHTAAIPKFTVVYPKGDALAYLPQYQQAFSQHYQVTVGGPMFLDITKQGVNKGRALQALGQILHIAPQNMMAFGDTNNDTEMLQTAGYGVLVANYTKAMADVTPYRTASYRDNGVFKQLELLLAHQGLVQEGDLKHV